MKAKQFPAEVYSFEDRREASITAAGFSAGNEGECCDNVANYNAKVQLWEDEWGNLAYYIMPHGRTGRPRYDPLFNTEHATVATTKRDIRIVFRFPLRLGFMAAAQQFASETFNIVKLLILRATNHCTL